jgi:hypothetical protein
MQQFEHEELGHTCILDTITHMPQSLRRKMQVFKMRLLGCQITLDINNAL